ncbi:SelT/SelW/SelH family protein [Dyadobacter jejuensis]|nr:SelT/SelW/SelH family protein [Dyadobacter jejuensis]
MLKASIIISYCPRCGWLLRSAWLAQELLTTFVEDLHSVSLAPAEQAGEFKIWVNDSLIWERKRDGGFPEAKALKQLVRDQIAPDKPLGHSDKK